MIHQQEQLVPNDKDRRGVESSLQEEKTPSSTSEEDRFLHNRQARWNQQKNDNETNRQRRQAQADAIHLFRQEVRTYLQDWKMQLIETTSTTSESSPVSKSTNGLFQVFQDAKEELMAFRKHCLLSTTNHSNSSNTPYQVTIPPFELPLVDSRFVHEECTRSMTIWETEYQQQQVRSKFVFTKYRQEVARRKALGLPPLQEGSSSLSTPVAAAQQNATTTTTAAVAPENATLQAWKDATIVIASDGTVQVTRTDSESSASHDNNKNYHPTRLTAPTLLLQQLTSCHVTIQERHQSELQSLHVVRCRHVTVEVLGGVASSIHVTDCHKCTIALPRGGAQQLRLHTSKALILDVGDVPGGAILEDCHDVVFRVGGSGDGNGDDKGEEGKEEGDDVVGLEVQDFNWLRAGVPSPNFRLERRRQKGTTKNNKDDEGDTAVTFSSLTTSSSNNNRCPLEPNATMVPTTTTSIPIDREDEIKKHATTPGSTTPVRGQADRLIGVDLETAASTDEDDDEL